ncbi:MAG: hypothetical protein ACPG4X_13670 [Pikeienuella sp.]
MRLEVESLKPKEISDFRLVEKALRSLKSYGPRSFAILTNSNGSFVQVAGGRVTCVLERGVASTGFLERAFLVQPKVSFVGTQLLSCGAGKINVEPEEFLFIDDVVGAFEAFFHGHRFATDLLWRKHTS